MGSLELPGGGGGGGPALHLCAPMPMYVYESLANVVCPWSFTVINNWQEWHDWVPCSQTCGGVVTQTRKRYCDIPPCDSLGGSSEETQNCGSNDACPGTYMRAQQAPAYEL